MYICFAEYRIDPERREAYRQAASYLLERQSQVRLYEGTDQPNLFVEIWTASSLDEAEAIKKERLDERSSWSALTPFIAGGAAKLHVWSFKPVPAVD